MLHRAVEWASDHKKSILFKMKQPQDNPAAAPSVVSGSGKTYFLYHLPAES
jgi:hypothetical protein